MSVLIDYLMALPHLQSEATALRDEKSKLSFRTLWLQTQRLAVGLSGLALHPGDRVLIAPLPTRWAIVTTYACWLLGLVVVPLAPRHLRAGRLQALNELEARVLIGRTELLRQAIDDPEFLCPDYLLRPPMANLAGWWNQEKRVQSLARLLRKGEPLKVTATDAVIFPDLHEQGRHAIYSHQALLTQVKLLQQRLYPSLQPIAAPILAGLPLWHCVGFLLHVLVFPATGKASFLPIHKRPGHWLALARRHQLTAMTLHVNQLVGANASVVDQLEDAFVYGGLISRGEQQMATRMHSLYGQREAGPVVATALNGDRLLTMLPGGQAKLTMLDEQVGQLLLRPASQFSGYWRRPHATRSRYQESWWQTQDLAKNASQQRLLVLGHSDVCFTIAGDWVVAPVLERQLMHGLDIDHASLSSTIFNGLTVIRLTVSGETVNIQQLETYCRLHFAGHLVPKVIDVVDHIDTDALGNVIRQRPNNNEEVVI